MREYKAAEIALAEAYARCATRITARDFLVALDLVRAGELMLPDDEERAVLAGERILAAVSRLRRDGRPITARDVMGSALDDALNAEARRQLAELGGEPPATPVVVPKRTPPRGTPAVPVAPGPKR